ncbi:MAG TPA: hypothetical protein PLZ51_24120, partial [Aggregatilineales bacterium]|nr:hypothetical protein [Aggregatilineales bacterium]
PILIGGEGEQKTFRLVAKYGDACNLFIGASLPSWGEWSIDRFKTHKSHITQKLAILRQHCDEIGRNYDEIEKTVLCTIQLNQDGMTPSAVIDLCHGLKEVGIN